MRASVLIDNATIVTLNPNRDIIKEGALAILDDKIVAIGPSSRVRSAYPLAEKTIDASGMVVFPGLINTHTHLFQTLLKGLGDDRVLSDWFASMTGPSAVHLTEDDVYQASRIGVLDAIRSGTTTMLDYMYPHPRPRLGDQVIRAFSELGIRGILGRGMHNCGEEFGVPTGIMQDVDTIIEDCRRLHETYDEGPGGRIRVWLAPAAVWSNDADCLKAVRSLASSLGTGITVHISETPFDREAAEKLHGSPDMEALERLGVLGPDVLLVHCVYLINREIRVCKDLDVKVSHNPVSNMYLSSGVAPIPRMIETGITVGLATDGAASNNSQDMIETLKFCALLHKVDTLDPTIITAEKVLEMATIDGARALGLEDEIGSLEIGKKADLFIFDPLSSPKSVPLHHPVSTLVYSSSEENIKTVIIDGKVVMEDGVIQTADEEKVLRSAQKVAEDLAKRAGTSGLVRRPWRSLAY
jgi:5-methylthioadenosine/S-adenosylhomocysteine deaminase